MKTVICLLLVIMLPILSACGGESSGTGSSLLAQTPARSVVIRISTSGTPSANIAGIGVTVTLPDGVTPALNPDGTVAPSVGSVSGVAGAGVWIPPVYVAASGLNKATLQITMASNIAAGFGAGEFATMVLNVADGVNPTQTDFTISNFSPVDVNGNLATGLSAAVLM